VRVAVLDDIHHAYETSSGVRRLRERVEEVRVFTSPFGDPAVLRGFDALVANRERTHFTRALFEQLTDLRIIAQTGNHVYHIDMDAAKEHGVVVGKATGGFSKGAAELTFGLMIGLMRQIPSSDAAVRRGEWPLPLGLVLHDKTLGIVGLGHVGGHVAKIARGFEMRVLAWGPRLTDERAAAAGVERCGLEQLLAQSDVVSVHATLGAESRGLLDAAKLALMKPTAYLINTARGPIVEEHALIEALQSGRISGAGLDVFDQEPLPVGHPLTRLSNVILTPHLGWPTDAGYQRFAESAADIILAFQEGRQVPRFEAAH
jgi:phosphoglycerate dehydrogenase-like enzyme